MYLSQKYLIKGLSQSTKENKYVFINRFYCYIVKRVGCSSKGFGYFKYIPKISEFLSDCKTSSDNGLRSD